MFACTASPSSPMSSSAQRYSTRASAIRLNCEHASALTTRPRSGRRAGRGPARSPSASSAQRKASAALPVNTVDQARPASTVARYGSSSSQVSSASRSSAAGAVHAPGAAHGRATSSGQLQRGPIPAGRHVCGLDAPRELQCTLVAAGQQSPCRPRRAEASSTPPRPPPCPPPAGRPARAFSGDPTARARAAARAEHRRPPARGSHRASGSLGPALYASR